MWTQRRSYHTTAVLCGFRRLIRPNIDMSKVVSSRDSPLSFVSTDWQHRGDEQHSRWVTREDGSILKLQSPAKRDIELLEDAEAQEPSVYIALIRECGDARALDDGKKVHAHLARGGLHKDPYVANFLIHMYGKCRSMSDAEDVIRYLPCPNAISWNIMMTAYARNGHMSKAKSTFDSMPDRTVVSWNSIIAAFAQTGLVGESRTIFEKMPFWAAVSWTTVMTAYAQIGDLLEAMSFFQRMPDKDVVSWTTMIRAHASKGLYRTALVLFRRMNCDGLRPDKVTLLTILESCDSRLDGAGIHACITELGIQTELTVGTALINMYGRCGCLETARKIFVKIEEKDVIAWTAMLNAYANNGHLRIAKLMLERMPIKNSVSSNVVITAFARSGYLAEAKEIFERTTDRDAVTWTAMIAAYAQQGQCKRALELFREMVVEGDSVDRITLVCMLYVSAALAVSSVGLAIHEFVVGSKMAIDATLGTALMNMYGKCGRIEQARSQFDSADQKDIVFWNSMIALYGQNGHGLKALKLFSDMIHEGIEWNETTLGSVLSACSHSGLLRQGRDLFLRLGQDFGVPGTIEHYICIIDLLARGGRVLVARELIDSMPFEPHAAAWTTFLSACKAQGKAGEAAARTPEELSNKVGDVSLLSGVGDVVAAAA